MRRAALVFARASTPPNLPRPLTEIDSIDDGALTAAELAALDLRSTWLVVLSGCDTGSGDIELGEGVLRLHRGARLAGAQQVLFTFWPLADDLAPEFLQDFYRELFRTWDPATALGATQRIWLKKLRQQVGNAKACLIAGAFGIAVRGHPTPPPWIQSLGRGVESSSEKLTTGDDAKASK